MFWKYVMIFFISMVPLIELRGAVPVGLALGMNVPMLIAISVLGNIVPVPFIYLFGQKFINWGKEKKGVLGRFCRWCHEKGVKSSEKLKSGAKQNGLYIALLLFVGVPLPGTGAWSGTIAASFLGLEFKKSVIYVIGGILMAALIMLAASYGLLGALSII